MESFFSNLAKSFALTSRKVPADDVNKALADLCVLPGRDAKSTGPSRISDAVFKNISDLLRQYGDSEERSSWYKIPRIYTILRVIDQVNAMDAFVVNGYKDGMLPFVAHDLPKQLGDARERFIQVQEHCLTPATELEKGVQGSHVQWTGSGDIHFIKERHLGSGGHG
jgi:hypothetical protein